MDKIYRKINDNRVSIPAELWETLDIRKGDTVEVIEVDNGILIQKVLDPNIPVNETRESLIKEEPKDKKYMLRLGKTKNVYIPKHIYDELELAGKNFTTSYTKELDENGEALYCLILSENGSFTYRKENAISLPFLFPNTEFEEGQVIYLEEYNENELKFKINHPKLKEEKPVLMGSSLTNMMLDNTHNRFKEEKEESKIEPEEPILNFKVRIGSGYVIYIPNKVFSKIREIGNNFEYILNKTNEGVRLLMSFSEYGTNSTQKSGALSLKSLMSPLELITGEELQGEYDTINNVMSLDFPEKSYTGTLEGNKVIDTLKVDPIVKSAEIDDKDLVLKIIDDQKINFPIKDLVVEDEEKEEEKEEKPEPIEFKNDGNEEDNYVEQSKEENEISEEEFQMMASDNSFIQDTLEKYGNVDEMIKDEDFDIREEYYKHQIEKYKMNNIVFNFITKEQLPKGQKLCYKCSRQLTSNDDSMFNGNRICNKCKTNELKRLFKPIRELAKIREEKRK